MKKGDSLCPALLLEAYSQVGLCVVRTLGRLGIPVYVVENAERVHDWSTFHSRYCRGIFRCSPLTSRTAIRELIDLGHKFGEKPVLFTTSEETATFVAENAERLREHFRFPIQNAALVRSLGSKKELCYVAKEQDIPTPEISLPRSKQELLAFLEKVGLPILLKPIHGVGGRGQVILNTEREVFNAFDRMITHSCEPSILQEYIPGGRDTNWIFMGYFNKASDCLIGQTGKSIRTWPVKGGSTTLGVCITNQMVEETSKRFLKAIGYVGIVNVDWRYDARDGKYKVLDVNPRVGTDFRIFVPDNDMDVIRACYLDMLRRHVASGTACEGRKWIAENLDVQAMIKSMRDRNLTIRDLIDSLRGIKETGLFAADDPLPFLHKTLYMDFFNYYRDRASSPF